MVDTAGRGVEESVDVDHNDYEDSKKDEGADDDVGRCQRLARFHPEGLPEGLPGPRNL